MKKIVCKTSLSEYPIYIGNGILKQLGNFVSGYPKVALISDSNVAPLYLQTAQNSFQGSETKVFSFFFPAGESSKTLDTVYHIYQFLNENHFTRKDCIVALGGGVVGDIAGFAAATYMRGIDYFQVPTTLLAQVDSSIGGKTGVDLQFGKNLVGAIYQPKAVVTDVTLLSTLSRKIFADGMAEVIKYGAIWDSSLFATLDQDSIDLASVIASCAQIKAEVVSKDERENGLRAILNFGHTLGHSAEKLAHFTDLSHGSAVAGGMVLAAKLGENLQLTAPETTERLISILERYSLPTALPFPLDALCRETVHDKKNTGHAISFILLKKIGESFVHPLTQEEIYHALKDEVHT